ncbi:MAG: transcriptional regulator [Methylotenera sp.]|uniref:BolA family protein n=1 Tax=Methylotenera sp. TaxID=2051956 RepID=UPI000D4B75FA|nr:BolA family protein [Methylotenera sp.]PPC81310.1 MAG: transcriptional regulator [Methylotenera sp.]
MIEEITARLQTLSPTTLDLIDESALHAGHQGNGGGGHYKLNITSSHFCGKSQIMRHRLIYQALADLMPHKIHALSIHAIATDEV